MKEQILQINVEEVGNAEQPDQTGVNEPLCSADDIHESKENADDEKKIEENIKLEF